MNDHAKVLFFANLRDRTGVKETSIEFLSGSTVEQIKSILLEMYPDLKKNMDSVIIAMNHEYAFDEYIVPDGAEIALFPPVSGGVSDNEHLPTIVAIIDRELDINSIVEEITLTTTGAACIFSGVVRGRTDRGVPHTTDELEYEAYQSMAESKMRQISDEIRLRWREIEGIAILQRIGKLYPGTVTVVIACTSSHRDSGIFEAAKYGIDRLKEIVPIWKKEVSEDGQEWVEGEYFPKRGE